jgi:pimeloyl-ACP methyl ester carboxylesterase
VKNSAHFIYLHGFASSPQSNKAQFFRKRFEEKGLELEIPSLDGGDFTHLTITGQLQIVDAAAAGRHAEQPTILIGSSLGGYLAALYAARHADIGRLVLLAPALRFPSRWGERYSPEELARWRREGTVPVFHYGYKGEIPLGYQLMEDSQNYEDEPEFAQPALVLHGSRDPVVPASISASYAARHPNVTLRLFDSGHELTDVLEDLWSETAAFLSL